MMLKRQAVQKLVLNNREAESEAPRRGSVIMTGFRKPSQ
jgi:hypothetical protein